MPRNRSQLLSHLQDLVGSGSPGEMDVVAARLAPDSSPAPQRVPGGSRVDPEAVKRRWETVPHASSNAGEIWDPHTEERHECFARNIENFIGTIKIPVGLAGPLRVRGSAACGDFYVPLATTESALVASYHRGARVVTESGGATTVVLTEGLMRAPGFEFSGIAEACRFSAWALEHQEDFRREAEATTRHGRLNDLRIMVEGNHVYLVFEFRTGDAAGQNMVTVATQAVFEFILENSPIQPEHAFVEANFSGDKKASVLSFQNVRGRKVTAEVVVPGNLVKKRLHTTAAKMAKYWEMSALGGVMSGTIGVQGHYANGLAALFLATGQDVACVAESAVGVTRFDAREDGSLYATVTLPNIVVGTVGGGTGLPSQAAGLDLMGLRGNGHAGALAEVATAMALAGELSIIGALCANEFTRAHAKHTRGERKETGDRVETTPTGPPAE